MSKGLTAFDLNELHKALFTKYISFMKQKERSFINEVATSVIDFKKDK